MRRAGLLSILGAVLACAPAGGAQPQPARAAAAPTASWSGVVTYTVDMSGTNAPGTIVTRYLFDGRGGVHRLHDFAQGAAWETTVNETATDLDCKNYVYRAHARGYAAHVLVL